MSVFKCKNSRTSAAFDRFLSLFVNPSPWIMGQRTPSHFIHSAVLSSRCTIYSDLPDRFPLSSYFHSRAPFFLYSSIFDAANNNFRQCCTKWKNTELHPLWSTTHWSVAVSISRIGLFAAYMRDITL
ncbi:hypothetical protein BC939DRAFT_69214 [Gamsiella multidivaricata]|uniref:uncharacterized protein n=1 Tax=Gamsiella multidivaricata TaxID=101098 RepID=UPI002220200F|nr:uncharacterized protein BC939DRAFT_69214 [Gamsiella multidivaricata]KAI7828148.1 hypothetical protein BC939DRAFT_69214 [Gamsiella multidivaricata]